MPEEQADCVLQEQQPIPIGTFYLRDGCRRHLEYQNVVLARLMTVFIEVVQFNLVIWLIHI